MIIKKYLFSLEESMEALIKLSQNLQKLNLQKIEKKILKNNEEEIIDLNISQLSDGEDAEGNKFPKYANDDYFKFKKSQGLIEKSGKHYNFLLTGDFREGFYTQFKDYNMTIDSKDEKRNRLVSLVSGQPIFGLQKKSLENLEKEFITELQKEILNEIL